MYICEDDFTQRRLFLKAALATVNTAVESNQNCCSFFFLLK